MQIDLVSPSFQSAYLAATMMSIQTGEDVIFLTTNDGGSRFILSGPYCKLLANSPEFKAKIKTAYEIH
jgi:hypothetical protein